MIEIKEKKCKGIGKAIGYKGCGKMTKYRKYGLCTSNCYPDFILNTDTGKLLMNKAILKAQSPRLKNEKELEKGFQEKKQRKTLGALLKQTQILFNSYIRLRDKGLPCISSDNPYDSSFDAGHCFSVGSYDGLRFDYDNCHGQSIGDNRFKEGNHENYLISLRDRIGEEGTRALIERAAEYKRNGHRWTREALKNIQQEVKGKIKQLK